MKVELEKLRLGVSALTDEIYIGIHESNKTIWKHKVNISNDFYNTLVEIWKNKKQIIKRQDGLSYEIQVKEIELSKK